MSAIQGVNVAAITPRGENGEVDFGASLEAIDFLCQTGVRGIALLGSTGEFAGLSFDERTRLAYMGVKRSRVPVLVGVGHATLDGAVALGREALSAGAAGLLVMPPIFFRYEQAEIREFYLQFAAQIGNGAAIYLYNIPFFTSELEVETSVDLLDTGLFAGIKDSSGCFESFERLKQQRERKGFTLLIGNDRIFTRGRAAGADGVVSGCAAAVPELLIALDRAIQSGDTPAVEHRESLLAEFIVWVEGFPTPLGVRLAAAARGIKTGPPAVPLGQEKRRLQDEFLEWFKGWLPGVLRDAAR